MMTLQTELLAAISWAAQQGWTPATGGNFSARTEAGYLVTASGRDKTRIQADDLLLCNLDGKVLSGDGKPSAESDLHAALYRLDPTINCVLHTHTLASTVLSRRFPNGIELSGFEMQKALAGNVTHDASVLLPVVPNSQDMDELAEHVRLGWPMPWGFLVAGHGIYAVGDSIASCRRHLEAIEFLLSCVLEESRWSK
ncbi:methylthioribulose 1-phosphate dehydratase [Halomonas sp. XH26]|uniref:Methylthioribulose-1-phosphate dehydratase n=1 Tax=Vreelandella alkaliphila TaxID=272774 RepID=A0AAJ2RTU1_9GAMM|nr:MULTISPECIES: methylthioribulose 1-phosphate dehydratase [Halomonas]AIA73911.1 aldolase [Halomonas campaniensis]AYF33906.1 methylthioribulose 1-phosphate dehydratase [Halomonas alkaliphila]MCD6005492.1 methylthioribulose 1-phosphate dehydratase [Halomonas sp. IOP_6]MCD6439953.1 methylthioribulose 1-phosphate dehydratase [Halomonas sp.]MDX5977406.1 methylthioribulose 1-phosphate dehydratase [Halomonas alkaliphila]